MYSITFLYRKNKRSSAAEELTRVSGGRERLRNVFKTLKLDLELGNVELKFKTRHCDSRILELNLYAESKHELRVGQTRV